MTTLNLSDLRHKAENLTFVISELEEKLLEEGDERRRAVIHEAIRYRKIRQAALDSRAAALEQRLEQGEYLSLNLSVLQQHRARLSACCSCGPRLMLSTHSQQGSFGLKLGYRFWLAQAYKQNNNVVC